MIEVVQSRAFKSWFDGLRDGMGQKRILVRIGRLERGAFGDAKSVGEGVSELRIDHGPGYRLYFTRRGQSLAVLLCGGDKDRQARDIQAAKQMAVELE